MTTTKDLQYWNQADFLFAESITGANNQFGGDLDAPDNLPRGSFLAASPLAPAGKRTEHHTARARIRSAAFRGTVPRDHDRLLPPQ